MNKFESLEVWKQAHGFVLQVYGITKQFPVDERFRLTDQVCRSASSIAANIVEGNARSTRKEYLQFIYTARGSLEETKYHLLLAKDLGYIRPETYTMIIEKATSVGMLLNGLLRYLRQNSKDLRPKT